MQTILTISTVLGGLAAVWFFWDKINIRVVALAGKCKSKSFPDTCLELPDDEFMLLDKISKLPERNKYFPSTPEEINLYNSLANYGLFKKQEDSSFKPTRKGKKFLLR